MKMDLLMKLKQQEREGRKEQGQVILVDDDDIPRSEQDPNNNTQAAERHERSSDSGTGFGPPEIDLSEIEIEEEIGVGSFGKVYKGKCRQLPVAIKILHRQNFDKKTLISFRREVKIMSKIFHPNICLFMGACTIPGQCMIVTELLPKGDLESILRNKNIPFSTITQMKMARDAALGMNWLHCSNPVFIHRDLKSSNLLVDENMNVKVCDFGLSQLIPRDKKMRDKHNAKGTPLWMAPEVMLFEEFNEKCDVYSYGIVLWEILTREEPFAHHQSFDKFKEAVCYNHERPEIPKDTVPSLKELIEDCWHRDPARRPSFKEIINRLDYIIVDVAIPDEIGREFWKQHFLKREEVPWAEFIEQFARFIDVPDDPFRDINLRCLQAIVAEIPKRENTSAEIVNIEQFGKVLSWFGPLEVYGASDLINPLANEKLITGGPDNMFLDRIRKLLMKSWFHGEITTQDAQNRLSGLPGGTFLVRFSSTQPGFYTISSLVNTSIKHQRVSYICGKGFLFNNQLYSTLDDIIRDSDNLFIPAPGSPFQSLFVDQPHPILGYQT